MLYKFDLTIIKKGYPLYIRFVDDIIIFSENEKDLLHAKSYIEKRLKDISLYMNSKKLIFYIQETKIKKSQEIQRLEEKVFTV